MEELKKNLNVFQLTVDRAEFFQKQEKYDESIKYYNKAINSLLYAKEICQYSDELLDMASKNMEFKTWLKSKKATIVGQLNSLAKYVKHLESSIKYVNNVNTSQNASSTSPRTSRPVKKRQSRKKHSDDDNKNDDDWNKLANDSIKLLCNLRSKYDFGNRNRAFETILHRQSNLRKKTN